MNATAIVPQRTCVGCGARRPQEQLIRVAAQNGRAVLCKSGREPGRGAYLCPDARCVARCLKRRSLERSLKLGKLESQLSEALLKEASSEIRRE